VGALDADTAVAGRPDRRECGFERVDPADNGRHARELDRRLESLPPWHPSSPSYIDSGNYRTAYRETPPASERAGAADRSRADADADADADAEGARSDSRAADSVRPLTDAEHADHLADVEARRDAAAAGRLTAGRQHAIDVAGKVWSHDRRILHDAIIEDLFASASAVPCEGRAILAGGLPGAGKTTVLTEHAGIDLPRYLMINPDKIKEEMAGRGMMPVIDGLTPMEASDFAHEESSHIAKRLAQRACADGKNLIWDITMSSSDSTQRRLGDLRAAGYTDITGIFVDIPPDVSARRADVRHREDHDAYRAGHGFGGRYIPAEAILGRADPVWGSDSRRTFEGLKQRFDSWSRYDNAADGRSPVLVESSTRRSDKPTEDS
jgi:predicted kinase